MSYVLRAADLRDGLDVHLCDLPRGTPSFGVEAFCIRDGEHHVEPVDVERRGDSLFLRISAVRFACPGFDEPSIWVLPDGREVSHVRVLLDDERPD